MEDNALFFALKKKAKPSFRQIYKRSWHRVLSVFSLRKKDGLSFNPSGLYYSDTEFEIFFPIKFIKQVQGDKWLSIEVKDERPGIGYVLKRSGKNLEEGRLDFPFEIKEKTFFILKDFESSLQEISDKIKQAIKALEQEKTSFHSLNAKQVDLAKQSIQLENAKYLFPPFCPITGEDCSEDFVLEGKLTWFLSKKALWILEKGEKIRKISLLSSFLVFILLAILFHYYSEGNLKELCMSLTSLFIVPLSYHFTQKKIYLEKNSISFTQREYFLAFLELNSSQAVLDELQSQ